jgi:flagellar hook-basal body complex protein FliE
MVDVSLVDAARAYSQALGGGLDSNKIGTNGPGGIGSDDGFQNFLSRAVDNSAGVAAEAETTALNLVAGQGNLVDLATAVSNAEMVVDTVVAVRDKVISAYNDIVRMPL